MIAPFGKTISVTIFLEAENGEILVPDATLAPDIYLYQDLPTRDQAVVGTGFLQHKTAWTGSGNSRTVTFDPIADPYPSSPVSERDYYIAFNFRLDVAGTNQLLIKRITVRRITGQFEALAVTQADLEGVDKSIANIFGNASTNIASINALVLSTLKSRFLAKHIRWEQIQDPEDLKSAAIFMALHYAFVGQVRQTGDGPDTKQKVYKANADTLIDAAVLSVDHNSGDDTGETEEEDLSGTTWEFDR